MQPCIHTWGGLASINTFTKRGYNYVFTCVGDVLGSSEGNTREILKSAEGCVLVIDEAYSLNPNTCS